MEHIMKKQLYTLLSFCIFACTTTTAKTISASESSEELLSATARDIAKAYDLLDLLQERSDKLHASLKTPDRPLKTRLPRDIDDRRDNTIKEVFINILSATPFSDPQKHLEDCKNALEALETYRKDIEIFVEEQEPKPAAPVQTPVVVSTTPAAQPIEMPAPMPVAKPLAPIAPAAPVVAPKPITKPVAPAAPIAPKTPVAAPKAPTAPAAPVAPKVVMPKPVAPAAPVVTPAAQDTAMPAELPLPAEEEKKDDSIMADDTDESIMASSSTASQKSKKAKAPVAALMAPMTPVM
jgi:hypothetical protein